MNIDSYLLFMWGGMLITWVTLSNSKRYRNLSRIEKAHEVGFCTALTAAITWLILDYFTGTPKSICLFVGAVVGIVEPKGWIDIVNRIINLLFGFLGKFLDKKSGVSSEEGKGGQGDKGNKQ